MKYLILISTIFLIQFASIAQSDSKENEWDMSYESLLNLNGVKWDHSQGTLFTWLKDREQEHRIITNFIKMELNKQPEAAFLIDHPTFPSGGRTTVLGIRKKSGCFYYWRSTDENMRDFKKRPMSSDLFTQIFNRLHSLNQRGYENMGGPEKAYAGFLSTFRRGQAARQVLLHIHDFLEFDVENQDILRAGRIFQIENSLQVNNK